MKQFKITKGFVRWAEAQGACPEWATPLSRAVGMGIIDFIQDTGVRMWRQSQEECPRDVFFVDTPIRSALIFLVNHLGLYLDIYYVALDRALTNINAELLGRRFSANGKMTKKEGIAPVVPTRVVLGNGGYTWRGRV